MDPLKITERKQIQKYFKKGNRIQIRNSSL